MMPQWLPWYRLIITMMPQWRVKLRASWRRFVWFGKKKRFQIRLFDCNKPRKFEPVSDNLISITVYEINVVTVMSICLYRKSGDDVGRGDGQQHVPMSSWDLFFWENLFNALQSPISSHCQWVKVWLIIPPQRQPATWCFRSDYQMLSPLQHHHSGVANGEGAVGAAAPLPRSWEPWAALHRPIAIAQFYGSRDTDTQL